MGGGNQAARGTSAPRIGIVGGGQLARMTIGAATKLGSDVHILERAPDSPAARLCARAAVGDWNDPAVLRRFAAETDVVTLENEFVDAAALAAIEEAGIPLLPSAACLSRVQDKLAQKQALTDAGIEVAPFRAVSEPGAVTEAAAAFGWPLVLKARRNGYDGKGNVTLRSAAEVAAGWERLGGGSNPLFVEAWCDFSSELALIVTVALNGATAVYPVVETVQRDHICHRVRAPAPGDPALAERAAAIGARAVAAVGGTGSFGIELFLAADGRLLVNELAPRVHNSGHYTIEACACSQFENHVRAVLGLPLGATTLVAPAAAMVNLLGTGDGPGMPAGLHDALAIPGAHVHLYGKKESRRGRKMGHVTALGRTLEDATAAAETAAGRIQFGRTP
jgi:5-(carboxyamino)imidazole ribonucleotide synthase